MYQCTSSYPNCECHVVLSASSSELTVVLKTVSPLCCSASLFYTSGIFPGYPHWPFFIVMKNELMNMIYISHIIIKHRHSLLIVDYLRQLRNVLTCEMCFPQCERTFIG